MQQLDVASGASSVRRGTNYVFWMFVFSLSVGIVALVLGGVAVFRTNVLNQPSPASPSIPAPTTTQIEVQKSLLVRSTAMGNQAGFTFLTFYHDDDTCSKYSKLYNPVDDPLAVGLYSNPVRIDKTQSQCFQIAYGISFGVISASSRYINFKRFASSNCSGEYEDYVRLAGGNSLAATCWALPTVFNVSKLYFRVTFINHNAFSLNYPLPSFGYESFDYHPAKGQFFLGNMFNDEISSFNPTGSAEESRGNLAGGKGYPSTEIYTLNKNNFSFGTNALIANNLMRFGLNSAGWIFIGFHVHIYSKKYHIQSDAYYFSVHK
jgi:hypothetical protein